MIGFVSTRGNDRASFREAVLSGLASDGGLYVPERIPVWKKGDLKPFQSRPYHELAHFILQPYMKGHIGESDSLSICRDAFDFPVPLVHLYDNLFALELFHGPSLAFKDFGARFLARVMGHFSRKEGMETLVLVATSGDTGSAVAQGFYRVPGIRVAVCYPSGKVSPLQEKQFATLGGNILALEVNGTFDDCQRLVKEAMVYPGLMEKFRVTTANSINVGRLLPQMVYYLYAWLNMPSQEKGLVVSVPSGNFGNLTAGLMAMRSGMPAERFVASTNVNRIFPEYLETGEYRPRASVSTLANAMDVGHPSNVERIMSLFSWNHEGISARIHGFSLNSDREILGAMEQLYRKCGYVADPHGAIGWAGLRPWLELNVNLQGFFLETAHPGKFFNDVARVVPELKMPHVLQESMQKELLSVKVEARLPEVVESILSFQPGRE
ncbi:MAG TPA: threonine synthase [Bacteroidetes bacterium]|nr:threonine synthase [Bacteroidota bacterium]